MGSGSLNAMAVFEASYKEDMTQQEAEALVARAIRSGESLCSVKGLLHHLSNVIAKSQVQHKCCTDLISSPAIGILQIIRGALPI